MYNQKQKLEDDIIRFSRELKELKKEMNKLSVEINPLNQQVIIFYSTSILLPLSINQPIFVPELKPSVLCQVEA